MKKHTSPYSLVIELMMSETLPLHKDTYAMETEAVQTALENLIKSPKPSKMDWNVLSVVTNRMQTLVQDMQLCQDPSGLLKTAIKTLLLAIEREKTQGVIRLDGEGIAAIQNLAECYLEIIPELTEREFYRCCRLTATRCIKSKQSGKKYKLKDFV